MEKKMKNVEKILKEEKRIKYNYSSYYNNVLVKEQPFYRSGMSDEEARKELDYLNKNLKAFYEGKYNPLWKQRMYR